MALTKCRECGHTVSDMAEACPHCGAPIGIVNKIPRKDSEEKPKSNKVWLWVAAAVAALCLIGGVGYYFYQNHIGAAAKGFNDGSKTINLADGKYCFKGEWQSDQHDTQPCMVEFEKKDNALIDCYYTNLKYSVRIPLEGTIEGDGLHFVGKIDGKDVVIDLKPNEDGTTLSGEGVDHAHSGDKAKLYLTKNDEDLVVLMPEFISAVNKYDELGAFSNGLAAVSKNGKWGYINTKGEEVIPLKFSGHAAGRFSDDRAVIWAWAANSTKVIDTEGNVIFTLHDIPALSGLGEEGGGAGTIDVPYYVGGKLYIQNGYDSPFTAYDKDGKVLNTVSESEVKRIYREYETDDYTFYSATGSSKLPVDDNNYNDGKSLFGVKDNKGNVVVKPQYSFIAYCGANWTNSLWRGDGPTTLAGKIPNGVILVAIYECVPYEMDDESWAGYYYTRVHYGYADLYGHDTFTDALKQRCKNSRTNVEQMGLEFGVP